METYALRFLLSCVILVTSLVTCTRGQALTIVAKSGVGRREWTFNYNSEEFHGFRECMADRSRSNCVAWTRNITSQTDTTLESKPVEIVNDDMKSSKRNFNTFTLWSCYLSDSPPRYIGCNKKFINKGIFCISGEESLPFTTLIHWPSKKSFRLAWQSSQRARIPHWDYMDIEVTNFCDGKDTNRPQNSADEPSQPKPGRPVSISQETNRRQTTITATGGREMHYENVKNDDSHSLTIIGLTIGLVISLLITLSLAIVIVCTKWKQVCRHKETDQKVAGSSPTIMVVDLSRVQEPENLSVSDNLIYPCMPPSYADLGQEFSNTREDTVYDKNAERDGSINTRYSSCV